MSHGESGRESPEGRRLPIDEDRFLGSRGMELVWCSHYLQALVEKSQIIQILERDKEGLEQLTATDGYDYEGGSSNVLKMLGYYSMVRLPRDHYLLGDYHTGLKCLAPIDISQQGIYTIPKIYHYGFANLMLRRNLHNMIDTQKERADVCIIGNLPLFVPSNKAY
ncbi:uncharacterized protein M6B38_206935 [Iris pallida]|uniref:Uncharacterized protein n=1 Tax=Iris pallida TaxID=29817 RepID=A0AAX6E6A7_IRIPA|nr:uncharacterized protein M6B38_206935 [Iris pallida]